MSDQWPRQPYGSEPEQGGTNPFGSEGEGYGAAGTTPSVPPPAPGMDDFSPIPPAPTFDEAQWGAGFQPGYYGNVLPEAPNGTVTLVFGLLGLVPFFFLPIFAPIAMILGFVGRSQVKKAPPNTYLTGRLTAGWILGMIGTVLLILYIVALVVVLGALRDSNIQ